MHAGLHFWRIEDELRLAAFLLHGVVALNGDLSEGFSVLCDTVAEYAVIDGIGQARRSQHEDDAGER